MPKLSLFLAIVFVFILVPFVAYSIGTFRFVLVEESSSEVFLDLLSEQEYEVAYSMTSDNFKEETSLEALQLFTENNPVFFGTREVTIGYIERHEDSTIVGGTISSKAETKSFDIIWKEMDEIYKVETFEVGIIDIE